MAVPNLRNIFENRNKIMLLAGVAVCRGFCSEKIFSPQYINVSQVCWQADRLV